MNRVTRQATALLAIATAAGSLALVAATGQAAASSPRPSAPLEFKVAGVVKKGYSEFIGSKISGVGKAKPVVGNCFTKPMTKATLSNVGSFKM